MMIAILCAHCQEHILDLDPSKLSWPFTREMFTPAASFNDWALPVNLLDTWCPRCEQMPFYADLDKGGLKDRLLIRGEDGRPKTIDTYFIWQEREKPMMVTLVDNRSIWAAQPEGYTSHALDPGPVQEEAQQEPQSPASNPSQPDGERHPRKRGRRSKSDQDSQLAGKAKTKKAGKAGKALKSRKEG